MDDERIARLEAEVKNLKRSLLQLYKVTKQIVVAMRHREQPVDLMEWFDEQD